MQPLCVIHFTELIFGKLVNLPDIKADTMCEVFFSIDFVFNGQLNLF